VRWCACAGDTPVSCGTEASTISIGTGALLRPFALITISQSPGMRSLGMTTSMYWLHSCGSTTTVAQTGPAPA
jgi:hypothetical protein